MTHLTKEAIEFLATSVGVGWSVNEETGLIDVSNGFGVRVASNYTRLPVSFGRVGGNFISYSLVSLKGAPIHIEGNLALDCSNIEEWEWYPEYIRGIIDVQLKYCNLEQLTMIIPEIESMIGRGFEVRQPEKYYYPYTDIYHRNIERRLANLL